MKSYHYAVKIFDSLRVDTDSENPLYLATCEGVYIDEVECMSQMHTPSNITQSITPIDSECSVSSTKFKVGNPGYAVSQWFYERQNTEGTMTYGEKVELYAVDSDKGTTLIYTGMLRSVDNDTFESYYKFEIADFQDRLKTSIFDREFSEYLDETVDDINTYRVPYYLDTDGVTRIGFTMVEQDEGDTDDDGEAIDTKVLQFSGHVIDFVEMIYQIIFSTDTLDTQISYMSDDWQDFVDTDSLDSIRETLDSSSYDFYFEFREALDDPFDFLTEHIYQPCAIFPYVNAEGKLGLKLHAQPESGTDVTTLYEGNILSVDSKTITDDNVVNHILINYGWKWSDDEASTMAYYGDSDSYNKFRMFLPQDAPQEYDIKGINNLSDTDRATFAQVLVDSIFARYSLPTVEIAVTVPMEITTDWKVGDYLYLSHDQILAWEGDTQGTPGIGYDEEEDVTDEYNGIAYFDVGHEWGAFISGNKLGKAIDGTWVITTDSEEINVNLINDTTDADFTSCLENHNSVDAWLTDQGDY